MCTGGSRVRACRMAPMPSFFNRNAWDFWNYNAASRFGETGDGAWYSLVAAHEQRFWRNATIVKTINKRCQSRTVDHLVQRAGAPCFAKCPQPTNSSSLCWIQCFFDTVLGPGSNSTLKGPGKQQGALELAALTEAWTAGFASDDPKRGGCPPCPADGPCPDVAATTTGILDTTLEAR